MVPSDARSGKEMELPMRISALTKTTSVVIFRFIAQVSADPPAAGNASAAVLRMLENDIKAVRAMP